MTPRIGRVLIVGALAVFAGPLAAQQTGKTADPKVPPRPGAAKPAAPAVPSQQAGTASNIAVPAPEVLLVLIRSALIALDHANRTGNYTVLRELGGPGFQRHPSAQLASIFANLRNQQVDLLPAAVVTPQLTQPPTVSADGLLQLVGYFPTQPRQIQFQIVYQPVNGQWKLFGMNVGLAQAPVPEASAAPAQPKTPAPAGGQTAPAKK